MQTPLWWKFHPSDLSAWNDVRMTWRNEDEDENENDEKMTWMTLYFIAFRAFSNLLSFHDNKEVDWIKVVNFVEFEGISNSTFSNQDGYAIII